VVRRPDGGHRHVLGLQLADTSVATVHPWPVATRNAARFHGSRAPGTSSTSRAIDPHDADGDTIVVCDVVEAGRHAEST
jgi:hypothetical protein